MSDKVAYTRERAADLEHEWDRRALDWPLARDSVVVDVGGFTGRWALQIAERYQPRLYVFEPQPWAADVCRAVLGERATVLPYGLGVADAIAPMARWETDGCTFVTDGPQAQYGEIREIGAVFAEVGIESIDLMMMNIEGYEYTLIPHMLDRGILPARLMVQFHTFADPGGTQLATIHTRMAALGYTSPWTYGPMLTAWTYIPPRKRGRVVRA